MINQLFSIVSTNPFGLSDVGTLAAPSFADIDNDGDLDAFVGEVFGNTFFYENLGTAGHPTFAAAIINPFGLTNAGFYINSTFADIDGDADLDVFVGNSEGKIIFSRNTGTASAPVFAPATINPFGLSDVGSYADPSLVDIDGDADLDAFVSNSDGNILFFRNTGTVSAPVFASAIMNPFGLSDAGGIFASISLVDTDDDGDLDAFVGNVDGDTLYFQNTGTVNNPIFATAEFNPFGLNDVESNANPTFADIDSDGDLDAFIGGRLGNILFFTNDSSAVFLLGTAGHDVFTGTTSIHDTVSYLSADNAVNVSLTITIRQDTVGAGLDTLTYIENLIGSDFDDNLIGNFKDNVLNGEDGNDTLNGRDGADNMIGGLGNDTFFVDHVDDVVHEYANQGIDQVSSSITYTLPTNVENLTLTGLLAINGIGNDLANKLVGNSAANLLNGGDGNDTLDGKAGADTMTGRMGYDSYVVDNVDDSVVEYSKEGTDSINSSVTYTLPANVENLTLIGGAAINGTGNDMANNIVGNSVNNQLDGGIGSDILNGGAGNDILTGGAGYDVFRFTAGGIADTITDFDVVTDTIQLENSVFAALTTSGVLADDQFIVGAKALDANDFIVYNKVTGILLYDADGNGGGAAARIAIIGADLSLTNADIVVI
ncbi:MAG: VCBS repeat-containing protein [Nitrosomonas sp.]|nr:VCBS repeat-containing protein [Nitrosomonas sp.]MBP7111405.1 VCBS repeat-containing protein [Nitrosomonas sp.]